MKYDLEERTIIFSKGVITILKKLHKNEINKTLVLQLIRSATSVGANYREANNAMSKKDFTHKIYICRKEIQETKYWFELVAKSNPEAKNDLRILWKEAHELSLIFNKISSSLKKLNNSEIV